MNETIKISRDTMIYHLTESMFDSMMQDDVYMEFIILDGFKGFNNYTDDELIQEYRDYISEDAENDVQIILENKND